MPTPRPAVPFGACLWCGSPDHAPVDCPTAVHRSTSTRAGPVDEQVHDERLAHGGGPTFQPFTAYEDL